jgi:cobalt-precorrin-7 (C5)-methyltransferase
MAVNPPKLTIVGCGPGAAEYLTEAARRAVARADVLFGSRRLLDLFPDGPAEMVILDADIPATLERIAERRAAGQRIAVLVSGDPGLYSLAQRVIRRFGQQQCEVVPAVSSVQVAFSRLGIDWADARILSAHGRTPEATAADLQRADKIAVLGGTSESLRWSAGIAEALEATHAAFLGENLTLADERFQRVTPGQLGTLDAASLSIVLLIRRSLLP